MNDSLKINDIFKLIALILLGILIYQIHQVIQMNRYIYRYSDIQIEGVNVATELNRVDRITGITQYKRSTWGDSWVSWNAIMEHRRENPLFEQK